MVAKSVRWFTVYETTQKAAKFQWKYLITDCFSGIICVLYQRFVFYQVWA
jgi:hypothetical protein